ncbi:MAG: DUF6089 family protein [Bacteroidota bacterium]|nr:DUF6089 family protein [Bacteroidota bacterium]
MKLRRILLTIVTTALGLSATAQDKELGVFIGAAQYQGDLSQKQVTLGETKPTIGILYRYYFVPKINFKGAVTIGQIAGDDKNYADVDVFRNKRNASFRSTIVELSGQVEYNIRPYISRSRRYNWAPYVFTGINLFYFNPKADYKGTFVALQPLGTEGQGLDGSSEKLYSRLQGSIPYGIGFKYSLGNYWNIGIEIGQRKTFTDYLDDVSDKYGDYDKIKAQRGQQAADLSDRSREVDPKFITNKGGQQKGDPKQLDMYVFGGITISKTFRRFSCTGF